MMSKLKVLSRAHGRSALAPSGIAYGYLMYWVQLIGTASKGAVWRSHHLVVWPVAPFDSKKANSSKRLLSFEFFRMHFCQVVTMSGMVVKKGTSPEEECEGVSKEAEASLCFVAMFLI